MQRRQLLGHAVQAGIAASLPTWAGRANAAEENIGNKTLTLGSSLALSGPLGAGGQQHLAGVRAAFLAINQAGGVAGRELKLMALDDAYVPARTVDNVRSLVDTAGCVALMSCLGTANNAAIFPLVEQQGVPLVGPISGASSLRQAGLSNVFHVRASYTEETRRAVQQLVSVGIKDIAIIYADNPFGKEVKADAETVLVESKLRSVASVALALDGSNAAAAADAALASRPGAVLLGTVGVASAAVLQAIRAKAAGLPVVGSSVTLLGVDASKLGTASQGLALTQVFPDAETGRVGIVRAYQSAMQVAKETAVGPFSFEGWVNAQVMIEGLRRAGRELSREKLRQSLASIRRMDLGDFTLGYASAAPYVASHWVELAVLGSNGKRVS